MAPSQHLRLSLTPLNPKHIILSFCLLIAFVLSPQLDNIHVLQHVEPLERMYNFVLIHIVF